MAPQPSLIAGRAVDAQVPAEIALLEQVRQSPLYRGLDLSPVLRSSGSMYGSPTSVNTSLSVRPPRRSPSRNTPYSLSFSPARCASLRTATLCATEPVK